MSMNPERIRTIMRYAVAVAANQDERKHRELGPIHLIKYVYLADLAHAARHDGQTYTGLRWQFYHFGPWETDAWKQIEPAMDLPGIRLRSFRGHYQDDVARWQSTDPELEVRLERELPHTVAKAVKRAVHDFANDTSSLLHHVYRTSPMLRAAPEERLDFKVAVFEESGYAHAKEAEPPAVSKTKRKRQEKTHDALRKRFQRALEELRTTRSSKVKSKPPRYDEVFAEGQAWLDSLAGRSVTPLEGELVVSQTIWKSPTRSEPRIP